MCTSIYIHIPFCTSRCGYCDFNTYTGVNHLIPRYLQAVCKEATFFARDAGSFSPVHSIFFGGGTPSLISPEGLGAVISTIRTGFEVVQNAEVTLEANPGSVSADYFQHLREIGFTRVSLGMQSADENDLKVLNRKHSFRQVEQSVNWAVKVGFSHISVDLIFGIPGQTPTSWQQSLHAALSLPVDHLSIYSLTIEDGTPLKKQVADGLIANPDDDLAAEMYEYAINELPKHGFSQYEISNWSRNESSRSVHNMQYWKCLPYIGLGAGAHGYYSHYRYANINQILPFIAAIEKNREVHSPNPPAQREGNLLDNWDEMQEFMMLGLRMTMEGVSRLEFRNRFSVSLDSIFDKQIKRLLHQGLLENHPAEIDRLRLSHRGILFGNRVFSEFVGNDKPAQL